MSGLEELPLWVAISASLLLVIGGSIALTGAIGLLRLPSFYQRIHGPAIISTLGAGAILIASMLLFSQQEGRPVIHELLITVFVLMSAPVVAMLIMRAAIYRDLHAHRGRELGDANRVYPLPPEDE